LRWTDPHTGGRPDRWPRIYFTLGTIFNLESGDLFTRILDGLRGLGVNVLVTVGPHVDPAEFGSQPPHVRIERYVPQDLVLPSCDLVVSHGGSGSVLGALSHGVPMVLAPMGADQPHNADRCMALGVAEVLDPLTASSGEVAAAAGTVLESFTHHRAAGLLRDEIAALPCPESAVALLEALA
jgi:MGT family glycosyltransferase